MKNPTDMKFVLYSMYWKFGQYMMELRQRVLYCNIKLIKYYYLSIYYLCNLNHS